MLRKTFLLLLAFIGIDRPLLALANHSLAFFGLHWIFWAVGIFFLVKKYKTSNLNLNLLGNWENSSWFEFFLSSLHRFTKGFLLITNPIWFCPLLIGCFDSESIPSFIEGSSGFELKCKNQRLQLFCLWFFHLYSNPYQSSVFSEQNIKSKSSGQWGQLILHGLNFVIFLLFCQPSTT